MNVILYKTSSFYQILVKVSDHRIVKFNAVLHADYVNSIDTFRNYKKADYAGICNYLLSINWNDIIIDHDSVELSWSKVLKTLSDVINQFVPLTRRRHRLSACWFTPKIA